MVRIIGNSPGDLTKDIIVLLDLSDEDVELLLDDDVVLLVGGVLLNGRLILRRGIGVDVSSAGSAGLWLLFCEQHKGVSVIGF
jgi:hypothetical protein